MWSLDWSVAHLNHGSFGAVPVEVRAYQDELRRETERNPDRWFSGLGDAVGEARPSLAEFCGADAAGFALVPNASGGVTGALASLGLRSGQQIVITDHAYGAVAFAAGRAAERSGAEVVTVPVPLTADDAQVTALIEAAMNDRTGAVVIDQITSITARMMPVAAVSAAGRRRGIPVIVDGAHAPGMLATPAAVAPDAAFWVGNLHKWACAPRGTAGLWVREDWRSAARPLITSWGEQDDYPSSFDRQGTLDLTNYLAAHRSIELLGQLGWDRIRRHNAALAEQAQHRLGEAVGIHPPRVPTPAPSMRLVQLPDRWVRNAADASRLQLWFATEAGVETVVVFWNGRGFIRLSAHVYNCPADYERLVEALPKAPVD
jgi:isopenicillin-N epimerase